MLRKITFSEVCQRLSDDGWNYHMTTGRCPIGPYTLRGEYDNGLYGCKTIAIRLSHIPGFEFSRSEKIVICLNFIYVQKVPWVTGVGPRGETSHCPPEGKDWKPKDEQYMEWWKDAKEIVGEDLRDGNLFSETYLAVDANFHKLNVAYLERLAMLDEHPIGSMQIDYEVPPTAFDMHGSSCIDMHGIRYSSNPCVVYINQAMTYWHNCEIVPGDIEDHVPVLLKDNNSIGVKDYRSDPIIDAKAWNLEIPTARMNNFHIAIHKADGNDLTPYLFGGAETVDDLMFRLKAYAKSIMKVNDYVKNNAVLMKKAKEYYEIKKEYEQKREEFLTYQQKVDEVSDKLVYDYQIEGKYHA